jgi:hypothetical protein
VENEYLLKNAFSVGEVTIFVAVNVRIDTKLAKKLLRGMAEYPFYHIHQTLTNDLKNLSVIVTVIGVNFAGRAKIGTIGS